MKTSHAYFRYIHKRYAWFEKDPLKIEGEVDYTNSIPCNVKQLPKMSKFKKPYFRKMNLISIKTSSVHVHCVHTVYASMEKDPLKNEG